MMRRAKVSRSTSETRIEVEIGLDGTGQAKIETGVGFLDHMLELFARHGLFDLSVKAKGYTQIDDHHTVEDVGIAMGEAFVRALGDKKGLTRYGGVLLPMDEALAQVAVDVSGRPFLVFAASFKSPKIGSFDCELVREWFQAFAVNARVTLHAEVPYGENSHHIAEALFKGLARALRQAVAIDPREGGRVPSTKGAL
jgi:imidazoleglycerol-phosphate dehydratase